MILFLINNKLLLFKDIDFYNLVTAAVISQDLDNTDYRLELTSLKA